MSLFPTLPCNLWALLYRRFSLTSLDSVAQCHLKIPSKLWRAFWHKASSAPSFPIGFILQLASAATDLQLWACLIHNLIAMSWDNLLSCSVAKWHTKMNNFEHQRELHWSKYSQCTSMDWDWCNLRMIVVGQWNIGLFHCHFLPVGHLVLYHHHWFFASSFCIVQLLHHIDGKKFEWGDSHMRAVALPMKGAQEVVAMEVMREMLQILPSSLRCELSRSMTGREERVTRS